jgi:uncharacterized repeat protein (TIGR01451 family)
MHRGPSKITCTTEKGSTVEVQRATASLSITTLLAGDVVNCLFVNSLVPERGTLVLSKRALGRAGTFPMTVREVGGDSFPAIATTTRPDQLVDAAGSPFELGPGKYVVSEALPEVSGGQWRLTSINCNGSPIVGAQSATVEIKASMGAACVFENRFFPEGSITIDKVTRGGVGATGFLIVSESEPDRQYQQSATTLEEDEPVTAKGRPAQALPLGTYVIQESSTGAAEGGRWTLESVVCDGALKPFEQGQVVVELTAANPDLACRFVNVLVTVPPSRPSAPRPPQPPEPVPPQPLPAPGPEPSAGVADVVVTKRPLRRATRAGQLVGFEITVRNAGEIAARDVSVVDRPRPGTGQIATASASRGSCDDRALLACSVGTLEPGASARVHVRVRATASPSMVNVVVVGSSTQETRIRNNVAQGRVRVVDAGGVLDRCASSGRAGEGRATLRARATRC